MASSSPMSLVIDGSLFLGRRNRYRGLVVYTRELIAGLTAAAPDLSAVITDPVRGRQVPATPDPDLEPVPREWLEWDRRPGHWLHELLQTWYYARRPRRPGEVLLFPCHDALPWFLPGGSVVVVHDLISSCWAPWASQRKLGGLRDRLAGWQAGQATRLVAVSESTRRDALRVWGLPPEQVEVCWNVFPPPDLDDAPPGPALAEFLEDPRPYLVFVGAREPRKGLRELLERWEARTERDVRLLVVAPSPVYDPAIEAVAGRLRGRDDFAELLDLPDRDRDRALARAACLVFPSRYEGFGRPVAEAMLLGTPPVTFANSSLVEVCGQGGRLLPDGDFEALLEAALTLARHPAARAEAAARARDWSRVFEPRRAAERLLEVLAAVAEGRA